jgi:PAS domain S-box-containing protein
LNGRITFWNHGAERTYGWRSEEVIGRNVHELLRTEFPQNPADIEAQLLSTGHWEGDLTTTRADGSSVIVAGHWTLRCDHEGKPVAVLEIHSDLTERRRLESQLLQAQKLEGLGSLVSGIAHDFNNILSGILGCASLLPRSDKTGPGFDKLVHTIISATERGASLVRQLLTFARKSNTKLELICINDVVEETLRMLQRTFSKTIEFRLDLSPGIRPILADSGQLYQVLLNLCVNARDAMPHGGLLTIATSPLPADAAQQRFADAQPIDYVGLRISDTGTGMDAEVRRRVFEPFFTTKPIGKGTGIGLAVVYGVVKSHRGFIEIESEPGRGTAFDLFFPAAAGQALAAHADTPQVEAAGGSETILAVEDEEILRALLATVLEDKGYRVICASDGLEALEIFLRPPVQIDLVISDLNMPRLGGIPLVQEIRKFAPQQKILICSGSIELDMREQLLEVGVSGFVDKPYRPGELVNVVRQTLDAAVEP